MNVHAIIRAEWRRGALAAFVRNAARAPRPQLAPVGQFSLRGSLISRAAGAST